MLVVKLSPVDHLEVHVNGGVVHTHQAVTDCHQEVQADDDDENDDDDDGHGACGQDGLRAERTDHTETPLTGDDGRYELGHPQEAEETREVVVHDERHHRPVPGQRKPLTMCCDFQVGGRQAARTVVCLVTIQDSRLLYYLIREISCG